jgi:hypothetical protein
LFIGNAAEGSAVSSRVSRTCSLPPQMPSYGMAIRTLSTREVYRNPWLRLREDTIERANGALVLAIGFLA